MTYSSSPNSGQSLGQTRDQIRTNSDLLKSSLAINHVDLGLADVGKHKFVVMPVQGAAPTTAASEAATYTKTVSARSQLFFIRDNTAGTECALTAGDTSNARFAQSPGWSFLPGGLIVQWGTKTNPSTSGSVTFATSNINFPTACFQVMLTLQHNSSGNESATVQPTPSTTGFSYRTTSSSANTVLYWIAIGN